MSIESELIIIDGKKDINEQVLKEIYGDTKIGKKPAGDNFPFSSGAKEQKMTVEEIARQIRANSIGGSVEDTKTDEYVKQLSDQLHAEAMANGKMLYTALCKGGSKAQVRIIQDTARSLPYESPGWTPLRILIEQAIGLDTLDAGHVVLWLKENPPKLNIFQKIWRKLTD